MKISKDDAFDMFVEMVKESWTYEKLNEQEKQNLYTTLEHAKNKIKGNLKQRNETLDLIYLAFLNALGYCENVVNWRDDYE